jgi:hypothetical protein
MAEAQFCAHGECSCDVAPEKAYCSEHCSKAEADGSAESCECGHDACE